MLLDRLAEAAGATVHELGRSIEGRPIRAARLAALGASEPSARFFLGANIHGLELIAGRIALGFLESAARPEGSLERLRERAEIWIVPCINPDGYARTWVQEGRGSLKELRTNARGVDLNRNFPKPESGGRSIIAFAGSKRSDSPFYSGAEPLSEPETRALADLFARIRFDAAANIHSCMGTLIPARVLDRSSFDRYRSLCAAFRSAQPRFKYRRLASLRLDVFTGEQEDHQHHRYGTWATCVETFPVAQSLAQHVIAPSLFWRFNPRDPGPWIDNDVPGIVAYFSACLPPAKGDGSATPA